MVIKLKPIEAPIKQEQQQQHSFNIKDIEWLFSDEGPRDNWNNFYEKNKYKFHPDNFDIYNWCVFPLITKDDHFYRCILHPTVNVDAGNKQETYFLKNVHFSVLLSHCIFYKPEEHKQYIMKKLFKL